MLGDHTILMKYKLKQGQPENVDITFRKLLKHGSLNELFETVTCIRLTNNIQEISFFKAMKNPYCL